MRKIMLLNAKGGCGKSTISTNLAAYYAKRGMQTVLMDYDKQSSSMRWLDQRSQEYPAIHGIDAAHLKSGTTKAWQLRIPEKTDIVVIDTPASLDSNQLYEMVGLADTIMIPVMPSHIDIYAVAQFIETLLLKGKVLPRNKRLGIIGNRVRERNKIYNSLERFLLQLNIPLIAYLRDTQNYVHAIECGLSIHELPQTEQTAKDRAQWWHLIHWLEDREGRYSSRSTIRDL